MSRPKPTEELKVHAIRMSDREWLDFKQWGGAARLRGLFMKTEPPHPGDKTFNKRKTKERND